MDVLDQLDGSPTTPVEALQLADQPAPAMYPMVADWHRAQGILPPTTPEYVDPALIPDITKDPLMFPAPRAHRLQSLARADTGGVLALGYASMRGYGIDRIPPSTNCG